MVLAARVVGRRARRVRGRRAGRGDAQRAAAAKMTIAYQPGIGYAPLILMKQQRVIEKQYPGTRSTGRCSRRATAITNGVISGDIQIGAGRHRAVARRLGAGRRTGR